MEDIKTLIKELTLEEKASLCSGFDCWRTKEIKRLGIPSIMVSDGPNGLRKQANESDHMGFAVSVEAVSFPTGSALGASFDRNLMSELGDRLGIAARAENLHTVLGPAINMKRSPLCGRNFEYISEDPYLAGELASSYTSGVQKHNVGVSVKHFAANNQEYCRMSTDTIVSERALREIYLSAFETVVKKSKPWTIMCAYNRLNGTYCCENKWLLDDTLRKEWGFDGIVITDWGAMNDRVKALCAGLELEMPSSSGLRDRELVKAVKAGKLSESILDNAVERLLSWIFKGLEGDPNPREYSKDEQHAFSRKVAAESAILLKNDDNTLPLKKDEKVVFIGTFADKVRYQGGGSSHVNSYKVSSPLALVDVPYYSGWNEDGVTEDENLAKKAIDAAASADIAVVFAGLPDSYESEGFDRTHINLPECQNKLISKLAEVQKRVVVVLFNGSPVIMPWLSKVKSVLGMNLGGEAVAEALIDILYGKVNPSGHLAETYPLRLEDNPSFLAFPGSGKRVEYREDIFIGYRWYNSRKMPVLFPFGHGLSYTSFELSNASLEVNADGVVDVNVDIENTGSLSGAEVVQLYIAPPTCYLDRPSHELKGFEKVFLTPNEKKRISFSLDTRAFSLFSEIEHRWKAPYGEYKLELGFSSRDIKVVLALTTGEKDEFCYDSATTIEDFKKAGLEKKLPSYVSALLKRFNADDDSESSGAMGKNAVVRMCMEMPIHSIASFVPVDDDYLEKLKKELED